jgi:iron-sulfur cluster assembly protein
MTTLRTRPAAVTLTPAAEARITALMANAPEGAIGVKLSTPRRGCSGLAYSVDYVSDETPFDEKIVTPGGTFYIDGASVLTACPVRGALRRSSGWGPTAGPTPG